MTDRPIICYPHEVRAMLDGRQTMLRRLAWQKPRIWFGDDSGPKEPVMVPTIWQRAEPEDVLYVREQFAVVPRTAYARSDGVQQTLKPESDWEAAIYREGWERSTGGFRWKSSSQMPRWASRLTLTVTAARVERLQDISASDAEAEGIDLRGADPEAPWGLNAVLAFSSLWESIHGPGSWDANPEVVAITVTVERRNIDAKEER